MIPHGLYGACWDGAPIEFGRGPDGGYSWLLQECSHRAMMTATMGPKMQASMGLNYLQLLPGSAEGVCPVITCPALPGFVVGTCQCRTQVNCIYTRYRIGQDERLIAEDADSTGMVDTW
jgi:hypothetical protein